MVTETSYYGVRFPARKVSVCDSSFNQLDGSTHLLVSRDRSDKKPNSQRKHEGTEYTMSTTETHDGYIIDVGCIRKNAREELLSKARTHTRDCALMGHCVESGYGIVTENDRLIVLDAEATPQVVDVVEASDTAEGIRLHIQREEHDGAMETVDVEEIE
jgi:hypothetical protein